MLRLPDSWVWDSWYAFDGELHHAFYLRASRALGDPIRRHSHPYVGHAVSSDLVSWTVLADALALSEPEAFDDATTWTGSVVRSPDGGWLMFYTGRSRADAGRIQRVGVAASDDLVSWSKASAVALVESDPQWYCDLDLSVWPDVAWRDPWVFPGPDGLWHMYVTARAGDGATLGRGVVGHATSADLDTWQVLPPLTRPGAGFGQLEVTQVEVVDGVATLIFCCLPPEMEPWAVERHGGGGMFSVTGPSVLGPFDIAGARRFPHDSLYAARLVRHEGQWSLIGFRDTEGGVFVGELTDPIPVTSVAGVGLVAR